MINIIVSLICLAGATAFMPSLKRYPSVIKMAADQYVLDNVNGARAIVRTYGGNAFSYITKDGIEVLGTRADAPKPIADTKPYAGGSPHCFPQFGPGKLMQHGFARGMKFVPGNYAKDVSIDRMSFKLVPTEETKAVWDFDFEYRFDITLRADSLEWDLVVKNLGDKPYECTLGMHTYFDVSSLKNVVISGPFAGSSTLDRLTGAESTGTSNDLTITQPVDALYRGVTGPIIITDTGKGTKIIIERSGFGDTCVWSPYGNEAMGYDKFICVEPVQCSAPVTIPVGKSLETKFNQKISCHKI